MLRKIIKIDKDKCNGCGLCAEACHEGAIGMADGKAALLRDDYCDGLGSCLPVCPTGAISFEERDALEYREPEVKKIIERKLPCGCPGSNAKSIEREHLVQQHTDVSSQLAQWPVQIKLIPVNAPYFNNADLLVTADCVAYAYANFHNDFMRNNITIIGCPKLDDVDYGEKLTEILSENNIKSVTVVRMEVPCCGGIEHAVKAALQACGKMIPLTVVTVSTDGKIVK